MKVLHLISGGDSGGAKTHVLSLLADLNKNICADLVCYMEAEFSHDAREMGIQTSVFDGSFTDALKKTRARIRNGGYDIVHCHGSRANLVGALLKKDFSIPFISTVHSDYKLDYLGRPFAKMTYGVLNAASLRKMDYHVCVSDCMRDTLIERGYKPNELFAIYNGVDFSAEREEISREKWFEEIGCGFSKDDIVVGIAARFDAVKDVATTIRGFAKAAQANSKLRLLIAGDGKEKEMLTSLAAELGMGDRVFFAGWLHGMDGYYSAIDINVVSSLSETFPYTVTEAARAHVPTLSTPVGGVPKLVENNVTGMLFEVGNCDMLASQIRTLASDAELRQRLGNAVYEKAKREFSTDSTCRRQIEIYETVLSRHKKKLSGERDKIIVCGAYGHGNMGDEAILTALLNQLRSLGGDMQITVVSKSPIRTQIEHDVNAISRGDFRKLKELFKASKMYVNGGGSLVQDVTSRRSLWYYLYTIYLAKKAGCIVQMYGCGIGPIEYAGDIRQTAKILNECVDAITLRDPDSVELLEGIGVTKPVIKLAADPVLSLSACTDEESESFMAASGLRGGEYICFGLRQWKGVEEKTAAFAEAAKYAYDYYKLTPVYLLINREQDLATAETVRSMSGVPGVILPPIESPELAIGVLSKMKLTVGMRLHCLLFSANGGTKIIGVSYDPKVSSFTEYIGCGKCIELEALTADALKKRIDEAINSNEEIFAEKMNRVLKAERINIETARELLAEENNEGEL